MMKKMLMALLLCAISAAAFGQALSSIPPAAQIDSQFGKFVRPSPGYTEAIVLAANVSQTETIPTAAGKVRWVIFASTCNFFAAIGASAAVPAVTTTNGLAPELNPTAWFITPTATQITVVANAACTVTMSFYL